MTGTVPPPAAACATRLIVIVNWRDPGRTLAAAASVSSQMRTGDRLVIVDNGSGDSSVVTLREAGLTVVESPENLGFGGGVNLGARGMTEDLLVLLNNDAVAAPGFLDAIARPLELPGDSTRSPLAATTARILLTGRWRPARPDESALVGLDGRRWTRQTDGGADTGVILVNSTGNVVDASGNGYDRDWLADAASCTAEPEVFGLCGGACAIHGSAWRAVGGFRENLFMYYEDTELSWRLREAGWRIEYVSDAVVHHEHAASSGTDSPLFVRVNARNRILVAAQHGPVSMVVSALLRTTGRVLRGPSRRPVAQGLAQALLRLPGAVASRTSHRRRLGRGPAAR